MQPPAATALLSRSASMPAQLFGVQLSRDALRRMLLILSVTNLALAGTTALFIYLWARFDELGPTARVLTRHVLVQGHLATENVVAAWYSSLLFLSAAGLSLLAFKSDRQHRSGLPSTGWLILGGVFVVLSLDELGSLHERVGMIRAFSPWDAPAGWIYVLAIPIVGVALFMALFAVTHVRRVRATAGLMGVGILLFVSNPVLESIEMRLIHGADARAGTWQRHVHDSLLVVEEGGFELFGVLCFIAAIGTYVLRTSPSGVTFTSSLRTRLFVSGLLCAGAFVSPRLVDALPAGDSGLPQHWFPAVGWAAVGLAAFPVSRVLTGVATAISAGLGSGLYMYSSTLTSSAAWVVPVGATMLSGVALEAVLWSYRFSRSPRSSTASPTLRRPRPNPS